MHDGVVMFRVLVARLLVRSGALVLVLVCCGACSCSGVSVLLCLRRVVWCCVWCVVACRARVWLFWFGGTGVCGLCVCCSAMFCYGVCRCVSSRCWFVWCVFYVVLCCVVVAWCVLLLCCLFRWCVVVFVLFGFVVLRLVCCDLSLVLI